MDNRVSLLHFVEMEQNIFKNFPMDNYDVAREIWKGQGQKSFFWTKICGPKKSFKNGFLEDTN